MYVYICMPMCMCACVLHARAHACRQVETAGPAREQEYIRIWTACLREARTGSCGETE